jgi:hypothetical protein
VAGERALHFAIDGIEGLVAMAQMGVTEIHSWSARAEDVEHPDRLIFDLDPAEDVPFAQVNGSLGPRPGVVEQQISCSAPSHAPPEAVRACSRDLTGQRHATTIGSAAATSPAAAPPWSQPQAMP